MVGLRSKSWNEVGAYVKDVRCDGSFETDLQYECSRLSVTLDLVGKHPIAASKPFRSTSMREDTIHQMNFAPANSPIWAYSNKTKFFRHISFTFQDNAIAALLDEQINPERAFTPRYLFFDAGLFHIAKLFEIECESAEPTDTLYGDTLALALLLRLASLNREQPPSISHGGLPPQQLRQVTDYLVEHLADRISLRELANITHRSRSHFSRAFRASSGMPPHQWLMNERVQKAKEHLLDGKLAIADIALAVGFSDQAHLTRVFSRAVGASPAVWRRQRLG
jgi:AraC family transcriptional regulator